MYVQLIAEAKTIKYNEFYLPEIREHFTRNTNICLRSTRAHPFAFDWAVNRSKHYTEYSSFFSHTVCMWTGISVTISKMSNSISANTTPSFHLPGIFFS